MLKSATQDGFENCSTVSWSQEVRVSNSFKFVEFLYYRNMLDKNNINIVCLTQSVRTFYAGSLFIRPQYIFSDVI